MLCGAGHNLRLILAHLRELLLALIALIALGRIAGASPRRTHNPAAWRGARVVQSGLPRQDAQFFRVKLQHGFGRGGVPSRWREHHGAAQLLQALLGRLPKEYIIERCLVAARESLMRGVKPDVTIADVAQACGFSHVARFSKLYQQRFREKPSTTRRSPTVEV
jgi:hypothetical protein